ncbi:MAG: glycyl-radical enzyme activating protein [Anaerolineales bacterium]
MATGIIFDFKRFSINDGPGIRTTVFLKGCPLSCAWCHNPESQQFSPELIIRPERCIGCGACLDVCPEGAISTSNNLYFTDRQLCKVCGACVEICFSEAREIIGREMTADEVIKEVLQDQAFFDQSGGGVTFSGGEPLYQPDFLEALLKISKKNKLHTTLDTCGYAHRDVFLRLLPDIDLVLYDVKIIDDRLHQQYTGVSNNQVKENLSSLVMNDQIVIIRYPVLPGINDSEEQIRKLGEYIKGLKRKIRVDLLPYHELSRDKYRRLGRHFIPENWRTPSGKEMQKIQGNLSEFGLEVTMRAEAG